MSEITRLRRCPSLINFQNSWLEPYRQIYRIMDRKDDNLIKRKRYSIDKIDRNINTRQKHKYVDRQIDRQIDIYKYTYIYVDDLFVEDPAGELNPGHCINRYYINTQIDMQIDRQINMTTSLLKSLPVSLSLALALIDR